MFLIFSNKPTLHDPKWFKISQDDLSKQRNMTIHFFITCHKSMADYFDNNMVVIFFGSNKLGNWKQPVVEMKPV